MNRPICDEIAEDFSLWSQYIDPHATMTKRGFDDLSMSEKLKTIHDLFPLDCNCGHMAAVMLGRKGGKSRSPSKTNAARVNGKRGGRPKTKSS